jgi:HEAT repeat protein
VAGSDPDDDVVLAAVRAVAAGWRNLPWTEDWLRERAETDARGTVRATAVQGVVASRPGDLEVVGWLLGSPAADDSERVRLAVVLALAEGWPDDPRARSVIRAAADDSTGGAARPAAVHAIGSGDDDLSLLRRLAIEDADQAVRRAAVAALVAHDHPETPTWLRKQAAGNESWAVRLAALEALASWPRAASDLPWLAGQGRADPSWAVRRAAVRAASHCGPSDPRIRELLREVALDDDEDVRHTAIELLAWCWREDAGTLPLIRERATADRHESVRYAALHALATHWREDPATLALVRSRAEEDTSDNIRRTSVEIMAARHADDPGIVPWLMRVAVEDTAEAVRAAALLAIGRHRDPAGLAWFHERRAADEAPAAQAAIGRVIATLGR